MNDYVDALAEHLVQLEQAWRENRHDLESKWTSNRNAWRRISDGEWKADEGEDWRSKTFVAVTKQKIVAALSLITDQLLEGGKLPYAIELCPWDENRMPPKQLEQATRAMKDRIDAQLDACDSDREVMRVLLSGAIYGEAWAKRMVREMSRKGYREIPETVSDDPATTRWEAYTDEIPAPAWEYVSVWDMLTDLEAADRAKAIGVMQCQYMSPYEVRQLADDPLAIAEGIERAIKEASQGAGSDREDLPPYLDHVKQRRRKIKVREYWGRVPTKLAERFEAKLGQAGAMVNDDEALDGEDIGEEVEIHAIMAGKEIVRYARTRPDDRPYMRFVWEEPLDDPGGIGVADNTKDAQLMVNGTMRAFEDNIKLSGNVLLAVKRRFLLNPDQPLKPGTIFDLAEECEDARQAIQQVVIQNVGDTLLPAIDLSLRMADDDSNIPRVQQGQESSSRETAFELGQRLEKSGKYLGQVIKNLDDGITDPLTNWYLAWNMEDPDVTEGKGNFLAKATGFASMQNRLQRLTAIRDLFAIVLGDEELKSMSNLRRLLEELVKLIDMDPDEAMKPEDQPPPPPSEAELLELDKLRADTANTRAKARAQLAQIDMDRERLEMEKARVVQEFQRQDEEAAASDNDSYG